MNFREDEDISGIGSVLAECFAPVESVTPRESGLSSGAAQGPRILVAEDDDLCRAMLTRVLGRHGYRVDPVENGELAWKSLRRSQYDLLITDHNMPKLTGLALVEKLRAAGMILPIISTSGTLSPDDQALYSTLGVSVQLPKPFLTAELVEAVEATLLGFQAQPGRTTGL